MKTGESLQPDPVVVSGAEAEKEKRDITSILDKLNLSAINNRAFSISTESQKLFDEFNVHTIIRLPSSVFAPYTSITTNIIFFDNTGATENTWFYRVDMPEGYKHFSKTKPMKLEHFTDCMNWWKNRQEIKDSETDTYKAKAYTYEEIEQRGFDIDLCGYPTIEEEILSDMK